MRQSHSTVVPVHVWNIDVAPGSDGLEPGQKDVLSLRELKQAEKFRFSQDARRFLFRRRVLRRILGGYFRRNPRDIRFVYNQYGKPRVAGGPTGRTSWEFNFTHSRDVAVLALASGLEVGVDVEYFLKPMPDMYEVLRVVCSATEVVQFLALPVAWQKKAFFKLWTIKEAYLKALGTGLSREPDTVHLEIYKEGDDATMVLKNADENDWRFITFEPRLGYLATLAFRTVAKIEVRQFDFSVGTCRG